MKDARKTIALFLPALNDGGAERIFVNLAAHFQTTGYKVDLLLIKKEGPFLSALPPDIDIIETGNLFRGLKSLKHYIESSQPEVVLSALPACNLMNIAIKKAIPSSTTRHIISQHMHISAHRHIARTIRSKIRNFLMRRTYHLADHIIAVSKGLAEDILAETSANVSRISVIYNPVVDDRLYEKAKEQIDHRYFTEKKDPVFLSVGRLSAPKDYLSLLRAFSIVRQSVPARLIILGEGPDRAKIEKSVRDLNLSADVDLPGFVSNPYAFMARAAAFVHSTEYEGFGNVLVEALSLNTPVISTDAPSGPREILEDGKWGVLVPVGDPQALAKAMLDTLKNPPSSDLKKRAECFTIQASALEYLKVIENREKA